MRRDTRVSVVIPALNEAPSIGKVLDAIPDWVDEVVVADNGSTDETPEQAAEHGARVVHEPRRGYGSACLKGIAALDRPGVVVFLDADFSDHPEQMDRLVDPIIDGDVELVIGSRVLGNRDPGALTPQARFGNRLACFLIRLFWGVRYTDLGPFRAIRASALKKLNMQDPDYGWTVEMQIKAALRGLPTTEVPVDYRKRVGRSKVSGTVRGVLGAGYKILSTIFIEALKYHLSGKHRDPKRNRIIVFTRYPEPGETKTRLVPVLGEDGAAVLQREMTEHVLRQADSFNAASVEIHYTGADESAFRHWLGPARTLHGQSTGDLGARMGPALQRAFANGAERCVIVGIDSPDIGPETFAAAFDALRRREVVLGPATDGGYYLIGMRRRVADRALPTVFENIDWGTDQVFDQTRRKFDKLKLRWGAIAPLDDIDRPEDLHVWERNERNAEARPFLSIIIPTWNEEDRLPETLEAIGAPPDVEIIVVDAGSEDATCQIAQDRGARVFTCPRNRAAQMNFGSAKANGAALMFLHADTRLPHDYRDHVRAVLEQSGVAAGAFCFATDYASPVMRLVEFATNLRSRLLQLPYGDQALFMRKETFRRLGGFELMPIMEDFDLARRLKRHGRIRVAPLPATTCGRRWRTLGVVRSTLRNQLIILLYFLHVPPERLAQIYRRGQS